MSVVIVGYGMAGARFAAELRQRDPRRTITVFGAEPTRSYNRILLSDVLAGKLSEDDVPLAEPEGPLDLRVGVEVVDLDPAERTIRSDDGRTTRYDTLVFATGSLPMVPPVAGLTRPNATLIDGAATFRTLDDCRKIVATAATAKNAIVLGGGLLGLEAARGLAMRGLNVEVLHPRRQLMERQLNAEASQLLVVTLANLGVSVRPNGVAAEVQGTERVEGILLEDGTELPADLLVIACGVRPQTAVAERAGLEVGRGIVVDDRMRTSDPHIYAIGDCSEHRGVSYGFVAPAWEQAKVAAEVICGGTSRYLGSRQVARLKANGVDLATLGDPHLDDERAEVVTFTDVARGTYQKVVIRDQRLVGAILLGDNPTVGTVTQIFDRDLPVPNDPRSLLFGGSGDAAPATSSPNATLCNCNGVTTGAIVRAWVGGARTTADVVAATRASTGCGTCRDVVESFVAELADEAATEEVVA
ncbi:FAD-dependent oxidoreductase [Tenggerimyces flavus]|uniref:FAD-dependent oxidoreductase n=1 Tax=Tenggerimyces flavus TaxID=1708749 RepID=A0ABV7YQ33_9ACTN|nr:FAD-dependent oxidoreductase [Tenggerimyces flavus]MBM7785744.1 assimilatory nitrate reductase electron transfer subunit [Tenggerimyces flavus]